MGVATGDYDNDGFLDVVVANRSASKFNDLYHHDGSENHWLLVKLLGTASTGSAIGAKVRAQATIWGQSVQQMREISGTPYAGDPRAHFGLGDAAQVDLLRIEWPSGIVQELTNVATNQILTITEHQAEATTAPSLTVSKPAAGPVQLTATGQTNLRYGFEASSDLAQWTKIAVRTNLTGTVGYTPTASSSSQQHYRVQVP
jgi:hypothetical protein